MSDVEFLSGITMATFAFSGIFFLRFWKASLDRFYLLFCVACWLIAIERIPLHFMPNTSIRSVTTESNSWVYLIRLAAFCLILKAIVDRNRRQDQ